MIDVERPYRLSRFLHRLPLEDARVAVAHSFRHSSSVLEEAVAAALAMFEGGSTYTELAEAIDADAETVESLFDFFVTEHYIVPLDTDEDRETADRLMRDFVADGQSIIHDRRTFAAPATYSLGSFMSRAGRQAGLTDLSVVLLGDCFTQLAIDYFAEAGYASGLRVEVGVGWVDDLTLIETRRPNLIVFQPATTRVLGPLWDEPRLLDDQERIDRLDAVKDFLRLYIGKLAEKRNGALLLVQGVSKPQFSLQGRLDLRSRVSLDRVVFEINEAIREMTRNDLDMMYVDEEQIFGNQGKALLLNDSVVPSSHHGPIGMVVAREPTGRSRREALGYGDGKEAVRLLVREYLDCYWVWRGLGRIKCIVVDLDETLWPGILGEAGFTIDDDDAYYVFRYGAHGGIHQALKSLERRGVLLAIASKNDESAALDVLSTLEKFADRSGLDYVLRPKDFVTHRIGWGRKSTSVKEIAAELGIGLESILFIDDNPVEREDVATAFPEVRVLGADLFRVRSTLLTDPCLDMNSLSIESSTRTEMVKAQLERETERRRIPDEREFRKGLRIELEIARVREGAQLDRVVELFQRTNQFNTTLIRYDVATLLRLIMSASASVYTLAVRDKFTRYGVVAACVFEGTSVQSFAMSCRVLGLGVDVPFLVTALRDSGLARPGVDGRIVIGPRNEPCRRLFSDAGFREAAGHRYVLDAAGDLTASDPEIYRIQLQ